MYETFENIIKNRGIRVADIVKATGLRPGLFSDWKAGRSIPKYDKLKLIADYLQVPVEYLQTGQMPDGYYISPDARELSQFLFENPKYKILFDVVRKVKPEDVDFVKQLIDRVQGGQE